jgi:hypothetical protein
MTNRVCTIDLNVNGTTVAEAIPIDVERAIASMATRRRPHAVVTCPTCNGSGRVPAPETYRFKPGDRVNYVGRDGVDRTLAGEVLSVRADGFPLVRWDNCGGRSVHEDPVDLHRSDEPATA